MIGIIGFFALDLYFNLFAIQFSNSYMQLATILLFFPLAHYVAKFVGLNGLSGMGVHFHKGWGRNFLLSYIIGFSFWTIWNAYYFIIGDYTYGGINSHFIGMPLLEVFVGYLLGSLINDIIVRGYLISFLKDKLKIKWVLAISIIIYALDDFWYAGFSVNNIIFSIILGCSLTYTFYKTGSIWANTGIHFGSNIAYGLLFGQNGKPNSSLIIVNEVGHDSLVSQIVDFVIPMLMFLFVLRAIRFYKVSTNGAADQTITTFNKTTTY